MSQSMPDGRASHRERQETVRALRGQLREGRLSEPTFIGRLFLALDARCRAELDVLVADLPTRPPLHRRLLLVCQRFATLVPWWMTRRRARGAAELALPPVPGEYVIGRSDEADLHLDDISVSRRHALVSHIRGGWVISDLGSRNGTWVNGWRLPGPAPISPGDLLDLGSCRFVIVDRRVQSAGADVLPFPSMTTGG